MRVCQFRHFGLYCGASLTRRFSGRTILYSTDDDQAVKHAPVLLHTTSPGTYNLAKRRKLGRARGPAMTNSPKLPVEVVAQLRDLIHDLSNSIETIMQAAYLLNQLEMPPHGQKWVELVEESAQDAAHINRQIREVLREQR